MNRETIGIKELLEAGVHFGHQTDKWNPKMKPYIFGKRDKLYIIDLDQTQAQIKQVYQFIKKLVSEGKTILFVGTKRQAQEILEEEAVRCGMPYVTTRWLGGTLTNFRTIKKRIDKLLDMEQREKDGEIQVFTKKEQANFQKQKQRLLHNLGGIKNLNSVPDAIFIIDTRQERTAVSEAQRLGITIIGLTDTNSDPDPIDLCIVGNDDAIKSIKLITAKIADAVLEGKQTAMEFAIEETKPAPEEDSSTE